MTHNEFDFHEDLIKPVKEFLIQFDITDFTGSEKQLKFEE